MPSSIRGNPLHLLGLDGLTPICSGSTILAVVESAIASVIPDKISSSTAATYRLLLFRGGNDANNPGEPWRKGFVVGSLLGHWADPREFTCISVDGSIDYVFIQAARTLCRSSILLAM